MRKISGRRGRGRRARSGRAPPPGAARRESGGTRLSARLAPSLFSLQFCIRSSRDRSRRPLRLHPRRGCPRETRSEFPHAPRGPLRSLPGRLSWWGLSTPRHGGPVSVGSGKSRGRRASRGRRLASFAASLPGAPYGDRNRVSLPSPPGTAAGLRSLSARRSGPALAFRALSRPAPVRLRTAPGDSCRVATLRRTRPGPRGARAAMCVRNADDHCVLQFTLILAAGCVLHRRTSRVIHRRELFFSSFRKRFFFRYSSFDHRVMTAPVADGAEYPTIGKQNHGGSRAAAGTGRPCLARPSSPLRGSAATRFGSCVRAPPSALRSRRRIRGRAPASRGPGSRRRLAPLASPTHRPPPRGPPRASSPALLSRPAPSRELGADGVSGGVSEPVFADAGTRSDSGIGGGRPVSGVGHSHLRPVDSSFRREREERGRGSGEAGEGTRGGGTPPRRSTRTRRRRRPDPTSTPPGGEAKTSSR